MFNPCFDVLYPVTHTLRGCVTRYVSQKHFLPQDVILNTSASGYLWGMDSTDRVPDKMMNKWGHLFYRSVAPAIYAYLWI